MATKATPPTTPPATGPATAAASLDAGGSVKLEDAVELNVDDRRGPGALDRPPAVVDSERVAVSAAVPAVVDAAVAEGAGDAEAEAEKESERDKDNERERDSERDGDGACDCVSEAAAAVLNCAEPVEAVGPLGVALTPALVPAPVLLATALALELILLLMLRLLLTLALALLLTLLTGPPVLLATPLSDLLVEAAPEPPLTLPPAVAVAAAALIEEE